METISVVNQITVFFVLTENLLFEFVCKIKLSDKHLRFG